MDRRLVSLSLLGLGLIGAGCEDAPAPEMPRNPSFASAPAQTISTSSSGLHVEVRWSPAPPVKGEDAAQLTFLDSVGNPVDGLAVDVVPWMPAHGHGTSVKPVTSSTAPGVIVANPVYLFMSGEWQLRITISGTFDDSAVATVEIP
jgi:YtkA-like